MQVISYEDFLHNEDLVLKEICDFIGVPHFIDDRKQYFLSIPDSQKYLHQNVKSGGKLPEREIAWKQEMSDEEKFIITLFLKRELHALDYKIDNHSRLSVKNLVYLKRCVLQLVWNHVKNKFTSGD